MYDSNLIDNQDAYVGDQAAYMEVAALSAVVQAIPSVMSAINQSQLVRQKLERDANELDVMVMQIKAAFILKSSALNGIFEERAKWLARLWDDFQLNLEKGDKETAFKILEIYKLLLVDNPISRMDLNIHSNKTTSTNQVSGIVDDLMNRFGSK